MSREVLDEKILAAIEMLWKTVLKIRQFSGQFTLFQSILLPKEYSDVIAGKAKGLAMHISRQEFSRQMNALLSDIETVRPFVGESIWALYSAYQLFAMRQAYKVREGLEKGKLYEWDKDLEGRPDKAIQQLLRTVFSEEELTKMMPGDALGATARIVSVLEFKLLGEMNEWIFTRKYQPISLEKQQTIQNLISILGDVNVGGDLVGRDKSVTSQQ